MAQKAVDERGRAALAAALACGLGLGAAGISAASLPSVAQAAETPAAASPASPQLAETTPEPQVEPFPMKVNMVTYLPFTGTWTATTSDKDVVKLGADGTITARKVGHATVTCVSADTEETRVFDVTVTKSSFKPVAMTKLQCYKGYRKYMTTAQFKKAYKKAVKLATPAGDLPKTEKLQYVTATLREFFEKSMSYEAKKAHYNDPYGYLCLKRASCAGAARTTRLCLNVLGIKAEHVNENQWTHQWCRVKVGKSYWIADPYGMYCGKEPGVRKHPYL